MQALPLFSIIMPTYNRAALLGRALSSVVAQVELSWELLVGDDGSTDGTWPLLCDWQASDDRVEPLHLARRREAIEADATIDMWVSPMRVVGDPLVPCRHHPGQMIHVDNCLGVGMIVVRREAILAVGGFPEMRYAEDSALVKKLVVGGISSRRLDERSYVYYRDHADTITQNHLKTTPVPGDELIV
jgi:glycosyltransferase involved in cell wall biosynthesis